MKTCSVLALLPLLLGVSLQADLNHIKILWMNPCILKPVKFVFQRKTFYYKPTSP